MIEANNPLYEIGYEDYLKGRLNFLKNKAKELRLEIKKTEELLEAYDKNVTNNNSPNQLQLIQTVSSDLDFSVTKWKPKVFDFLFENTSLYTTEQILIGTDLDKDYQRKKGDRDKVIKTISSSLFQLHKEGKIIKRNNEKRRGFKWAIKEPT